MALNNLVEGDTLIINNRPLQLEFADGDTCSVTFPNDLVSMSTGKNKNTIYAKNEQGSNFELELSVMRGGAVDKYLNGLLINQERDFVGFTLMTGALTKRIGDGYGNITFDSYSLRGMVFKKCVETKTNNTGDTEQGKATYTLQGAVATRGLL